jgi:hypothetical protein
MKKPIRITSTVKMKLRITSLNKPRLFATHLKRISRNTSNNSVLISKMKIAKKSVSKSLRLKLKVSSLNTMRSELISKRNMKPF